MGGHKNQFDEVQRLYQLADAAGAGEVQAAMPDSLRPTAGASGFGYYLPATALGSLGRAALGELLQLANDYDGVILGVNLTNNAETGILVESLLRKYHGRLIITAETIEILKFHPELITNNPNAVVVTNMAGLFALANHRRLPIAIKPHAGVIGKITVIQQLADLGECSYVVSDSEVIVASERQVSLTALKQSLSHEPALMTALAATFWVQQPSKTFAGLTSAAWVGAGVTNSVTVSAAEQAQRVRHVMAVSATQ